MKNPYDILGISRTATRDEIKQRYRHLAMKHHPDRWVGKNISSEELNAHQEKFKNITVAYNLLMESASFPYENETDPDSEPNGDSWEVLWKRMEDLLRRKNVMEPLSHFLKATFNQIRSRKNHHSNLDPESEQEIPSHSTTEHSFTIPVTLEEIHSKKRKKVRLLLKDDPEPIYVSVMCDRYPNYETTVIRSDGRIHTLSLMLYPKTHPIYSLDYVSEEETRVDETSGYNLYHSVSMNLIDYFQGKHVEWIHVDGNSMYFWIPPFATSDVGYSNLWKKLTGKGLLEKGDLYITLDWCFPTEEQWKTLLNSEDRDAFILILDKFTHVNDCSGAFSTSEK